jgi:hypothetical protein
MPLRFLGSVYLSVDMQTYIFGIWGSDVSGKATLILRLQNIHSELTNLSIKCDSTVRTIVE